ncbi:hypothetical protein PVAND_015923 [Polypedilum vanderplanki]|uniref:F-box domain-containing protein n=1 Tax=Polypedilum vanderplanki TaxID=319348 RepID=A0A9J6BDM9_POLVA|nr:hypothetical protein PVAND_015923 [Polypedilum vanderplanki]
MEFLPTEILVKIFTNLNDKDLLSLTLVNTIFNDIISSTQQLSSKFSIYFKNNQQSQLKEILESSRKYKNLVIENFNQIPHLEVLEKISQTIGKIEIHRWNWSLDCKLIYQLLESFPNLRHVKFIKILFHFDAQFIESLINLRQLDTLEVIESDSRIFRLFKKTQVRKLVYDYVPTGGNFPIPDMIKFLRRQEKLEDLTLSGFLAFLNAGIGKIIFHNEKLSNVKFRLKKICLKNCPIIQTIHLKIFLNLHVKSLKIVELDDLENWNCSNFINSCENLEILKINKKHKSFSFDQIVENETVKILEVNGPVDKNFLSKFPNLKILKVTNLKTERGKFDEELNCNKIEVMKIEKSYLGGFFKFPKLTKLHLKNIRVMNDEIFQTDILDIFVNIVIAISCVVSITKICLFKHTRNIFGLFLVSIPVIFLAYIKFEYFADLENTLVILQIFFFLYFLYMPIMLLGFSTLVLLAAFYRKSFLKLINSYWWAVLIYNFVASSITAVIFWNTEHLSNRIWIIRITISSTVFLYQYMKLKKIHHLSEEFERQNSNNIENNTNEFSDLPQRPIYDINRNEKNTIFSLAFAHTLFIISMNGVTFLHHVFNSEDINTFSVFLVYTSMIFIIFILISHTNKSIKLRLLF